MFTGDSMQKRVHPGGGGGGRRVVSVVTLLFERTGHGWKYGGRRNACISALQLAKSRDERDEHFNE